MKIVLWWYVWRYDCSSMVHCLSYFTIKSIIGVRKLWLYLFHSACVCGILLWCRLIILPRRSTAYYQNFNVHRDNAHMNVKHYPHCSLQYIALPWVYLRQASPTQTVNCRNKKRRKHSLHWRGEIWIYTSKLIVNYYAILSILFISTPFTGFNRFPQWKKQIKLHRWHDTEGTTSVIL